MQGYQGVERNNLLIAGIMFLQSANFTLRVVLDTRGNSFRVLA